MTILIGDVHGLFEPYHDLILPYKNTIQIGDMGVGFPRRAYDPMLHTGQMMDGDHRFIRGNHDDPTTCREHPQWIPDGTIEDNVMFIGGAWSIDQGWRTPGVSWWEDEELSYKELEQMVDTAYKVQPEVMITHDAPGGIVQGIFNLTTVYETRTGQALERIRQSTKPKLWFFGHWHKDIDVIIDGTRFICLDELSARNVDFKTFEVSDVFK